MELNIDWAERSTLSIIDSAFILVAKADPTYFYHDERFGAPDYLASKAAIVFSAGLVEDCIQIVEKKYMPNGDLDPHNTTITKSGFLAWCEKYQYSDVLLAFENASTEHGQRSNSTAVTPLAGSQCISWQVSAREIAEELFQHDTDCNCRDRLSGYSERVMDEMRKRKIHGPRGPFDNPKTIQREALQGEKWWSKKAK
jgi:hypothetical protein